MGPTTSPDKTKGFTILEVIVVLAVIGIVTIVIIAGFNRSPNTLAVSVDTLKAHLRYAQSRAMNTISGWGVKGSDDGKTYWIFKDGDPVNEKVRVPGEDGDVVDLEAINISVQSFVVSFDNRGIPSSDTSGTSPLNADLSIVVSNNHGESLTVSITKNTGFIP